jgi:pSer/pThr/pTyr-binding forkhead associated (FHA) protein
LALTSKKTVHSIKVTDMSSTNGTFVNGTLLNKGKSRQVFPGDKIKVGDSVFEIKRC